jgi:hypothetical protein
VVLTMPLETQESGVVWAHCDCSGELDVER